MSTGISYVEYLNTPAFPRGRLSDFFSAPRPMKETGMYLSFWNGSYYSGMRVNTTEKFSKYTSENMLSLDKHIKVVRPTGCNYVRVYVQYDQIIGSRCLLKVSLRTFNKWKDSGNA